QNGGGLTRKRSTLAIYQRKFCTLNLARATFPAQLPDRFNENKDPVHARMNTRKPATVGVDGQASAWCDGAVRYKVSAFAFVAESQVFQEEQGINGECVVKFHDINVRRRHFSHFEGNSSRLLRRSDGEIMHG